LGYSVRNRGVAPSFQGSVNRLFLNSQSIQIADLRFSTLNSKTLAMPDCPRCSQPVDLSAIACPHCQTPLKAYGHPGIPLHRATGGEFLCSTCLYHADDTCNFPQRPLAKDCTLYYDRSQPILAPTNPYLSGGWPPSLKNWCQRHIFWLFLLGLIVVSLLLSL